MVAIAAIVAAIVAVVVSVECVSREVDVSQELFAEGRLQEGETECFG
jgi:hypothetical protein